MTVATSLNRKEYNGNGIQDTFSFPYKVFTLDDLEVYVDGVLKLRGTNYNVTLNGSPPGEDGCDVVFIAGHIPPSGTLNVILLRSLPVTQEIALPLAGPFPSTSIEDGLDRITMLAQDLAEELSRKLGFAPAVPSGTSLEIPAPVTGGEGFRFKADKSGIELVTITGGLLSVITTRGDLIRGGVGGVTERLGIGADADQFLGNDGTDSLWKYVQSVKESGGQVLALGSIPDGTHVVRSGTSLIGQVPGFTTIGIMSSLSGSLPVY